MDGTRRRTADDRGFTLVELLVVAALVAVLVAIAVPSYLSFTARANSSTAKADVRAIVPSIEGYFSDHSTYAGMTLARLQAGYDAALQASRYSLTESGSTYCVSATVAGETFRKDGPGGRIVAGAAC
ncbi:MAG TPA: prepilin-type N-terminal cleavage/methylation domain-containing protein [Gaiellaceae bacterium]|nr:prepilin-type N-terminal cleavage/methylation domain-containing protein [Gaiellaceae bacterium]